MNKLSFFPCDGGANERKRPVVCEERIKERRDASNGRHSHIVTLCGEGGGPLPPLCVTRTHARTIQSGGGGRDSVQRASEGAPLALPATNPNQHDGIQKGGGDCSCYTATAERETALATAPSPPSLLTTDRG